MRTKTTLVHTGMLAVYMIFFLIAHTHTCYTMQIYNTTLPQKFALVIAALVRSVL